MANISKQLATPSLHVLTEAVSQQWDNTNDSSARSAIQNSDEEDDSRCPKFDRFYNGGDAGAILERTQFHEDFVERIWKGLKGSLVDTFIDRRGKTTSFPKYFLFIFVTVMKHTGSWDFLANIFYMKGPNFERLIWVWCTHYLSCCILCTCVN